MEIKLKRSGGITGIRREAVKEVELSELETLKNKLNEIILADSK